MTTNQNLEKTEAVQPLADVLAIMAVLDRGNFLINCGRELQKLIDAVVDTNKEGALVIKLKFRPSGWKRGTGGASQVDISPDISVVTPHHDTAKSIFFVADNNQLTRDDPAQTELFGGK